MQWKDKGKPGECCQECSCWRKSRCDGYAAKKRAWKKVHVNEKQRREWKKGSEGKLAARSHGAMWAVNFIQYATKGFYAPIGLIVGIRFSCL